jgi:hypothetical protein
VTASSNERVSRSISVFFASLTESIIQQPWKGPEENWPETSAAGRWARALNRAGWWRWNAAAVAGRHVVAAADIVKLLGFLKCAAKLLHVSALRKHARARGDADARADGM